jgi:excinuclease ABC subunit C
MDHDSTDNPKASRRRKARPGSEPARLQPDLPPQDLSGTDLAGQGLAGQGLAGDGLAADDIDPATVNAEEDDEARLPEVAEESGEPLAEGRLAVGHAAIENAVRLAPTSPGVYRMLNAASDVLYVGKAKNVKKRLSSYARVSAPQPARILRMIAATVSVEIISTSTETEALLLEANLIKQLRPRFNVQLRDDKSFPYILITGDHWAPQILKHRGAQTRPGQYFGPFASAGAVNRTITALQRAFLVRSCTDAFFESRTRPCLLYQIRRCSGPCTGEIDFPGYTELVREARDFLSGRSRAVKQELAGEMEKASVELEFETAALYRDRLAALSAIQSQQGINPRTVEEADVFAIHQEGGYSCVEVFFFRTGQNWGNRAYFPRAEKSFTPEEVLASFLAQFYDDKPPPKLILLSHAIEECELMANALSIKAGGKVEIVTPRRGEKKELVAHALTNAREALGRKLADTATQGRLLTGLVTTLGLSHAPKRIEVYDNSHIQGSNAVGAMIVAGPDGFSKNQYRKFNIKSEGLTPGDDYAAALQAADGPPGGRRRRQAAARRRFVSPMARSRHYRWRPRPAQRGAGDFRGARIEPGRVAGRGKRAGPRRRPRDPVHAGARGHQARAARPGAVLHPAAARRGASLRDRLAPQAAQKGHSRSRIAGDSRHRPLTQTCLAAPFRNPEGDRAGVDRRSRQGSRRQRGKRTQDFRVFPCPAGVKEGFDSPWRRLHQIMCATRLTFMLQRYW